MFRFFSRGKTLPPSAPMPVRPQVFGVGPDFEGPHWRIDVPLIQLSQQDSLSARDLFEGVLILGNPGSGKTSSSGRIIPQAALRDGWGVVAYTTKPDDAALWEKLCAETGRSKSLRFIRPDGKSHFNLMRYELERTTPGGGSTLRLGSFVTEMINEGKPRTQPSEASDFFQQATYVLLCNVIDALRLAGMPVTFKAMQRFLASAPIEPPREDDEHWKSSFCFEVLKAANEKARTPQDLDVNEIVGRYFLSKFCTMNERTRGDILATVEAALFQLDREPVRQLLDSPQGLNFVPEMLEEGSVIVIDCPASVYGTVGRMLTICFKRLVKEMLRRRVLKGDRTRPVLNFADECQTCATRDDAEFFQVARSNRVANVYLTQSIDNLEVALGSEPHVNSLANALTTHVVHCTSGRTAQWVEGRIAKAWMDMEASTHQPHNPEGGKQGYSVNMSQQLHSQVLASEFTKLRTGGSPNNNIVECVVFKPGRFFKASNAPFLRVRFQQ